MEARIYPEGTPFPFTTEWYAGRHHADHRSDPWHHQRFAESARAVLAAVEKFGLGSVVDLGGGDGGFLQQLGEMGLSVPAWGYDLMPTNVEHAQHHRGVDIRFADFLVDPIEWGELVNITECLEHLEDPHGTLRMIGQHAKACVASSPCRETAEHHDTCHAWAWDMDGYRALFEGQGWRVLRHVETNDGYGFQVITAWMP